jgi:phytanoyl-CoA hydroxylase
MTVTEPAAAADQQPTPQQVRQFRREGWTKIEALLDPAGLARARGALQSAQAEHERGARGPAYRDDPEYRKVMLNLRRLPAATSDLGIGWDPRLAKVARDLLSADHVQLWQEGPLIKPPRRDGSKPTRWHQDFALLPFDRRDAVTVWIALDDLPVERGTLAFLPGSHRLGPLGRVNFAVDGVSVDHLRASEDGDLLGEVASNALNAGDATVHGPLILHSAGQNRTSTPRRAWAVSYVSSEVRYTGAPSGSFDGLDLALHEPLRADLFPVIV